MNRILGPFSQILTMDQLPSRGPIRDEQLEIVPNGGIVVEDGLIQSVGDFRQLRRDLPDLAVQEVEPDQVALPGIIDCHTHLCFGGSRANDYAARNNGVSYQDIAAAGGGIWDTVTKTRAASQQHLCETMATRLHLLLSRGVTTVEVKSGYGLSRNEELKLLRAIAQAKNISRCDVVSTCLAAHIIPHEFEHESAYLDYVLDELVPLIRDEKLANRFDIFIEQNAFSPSKSKSYLQALQQAGFDITVHGDQFSTGGSQTAIEVGAVSVDHLEASGEKEIQALAQSETIPVVLPGASFGLGLPFAPARRLLDAGCSLAIASDWNPGSAPQGNLLAQASILGAYEKLSAAEVFAGIMYRAAKALRLEDRGLLRQGKIADIIAFSCKDYREILYHQGELQPSAIWKKGDLV